MMKKIIIFALLIELVAPTFVLASSQNITLQEKIQSLTNEISIREAYLNPVTIKDLSPEQMRSIIKAATLWLQASQESNGHFGYEYSPYSDSYSNGDNIVRQSGALYELGEITIRDTKGVYDLDDSITRAISYFDDNSVTSTYNGKTVRCVASGSQCKLGTTSLAFIGILDYAEKNPSAAKKYTSLINNYANYIMAMQKPNGGFREIFFPSTGTANDAESSYSNGEALLAYVRYAKSKGFPNDLKINIDKTISYIQSSAVPFDSSLYLWAMVAMKDLNAYKPNPSYLSYAKRYTDWRMIPFKNKAGDDHNYCPYIEGMVGAYPILKQGLSANDLAKYTREINFWLAKSSLLQVKKENLVRFDPTNPNLFSRAENQDLALGGFLTGYSEPTQRIDFTQHCISSYMQWLVDINGNSL